MGDKLTPPPVPPADRIEHATDVLARLGEVRELDDWRATFRRDTLELTGVWPAEDGDTELSEFEVPIERLSLDAVDPDGSLEQHRRRCRLAVKQGIERGDLDLRLMREALTVGEAS